MPQNSETIQEAQEDDVDVTGTASNCTELEIVHDDEVAANLNDSDDAGDPNDNTPMKQPAHSLPVVIHGTPALASPPKSLGGLIPGSLKKTFLGNLDGSSLVFQLVDLQKKSEMNCYAATLSDGQDTSKYCLFYTNLSTRVKALVGALENNVFPLISILEYDILSFKFLAVADFKCIKTCPNIIGEPCNIEDDFFSNLKKGLAKLPNDKKMRGILARNIPTSKRKRLIEAEVAQTPLLKRTRTTKRRLL